MGRRPAEGGAPQEALLCARTSDVFRQPEVLALVRAALAVHQQRRLGVVGLEATHVVRRALHEGCHLKI
jgi:hypothetical protein